MDLSMLQELNQKIEKIQTQRTKEETRREVILARLNSEIEDYKAKYGVDLNKGRLSDTIKCILAEKEKVSKVIEEEYSRKKKVVDAIDSGDIALANSLLGIATEDEVSEVFNADSEAEVSAFEVEDVEDDIESGEIEVEVEVEDGSAALDEPAEEYDISDEDWGIPEEEVKEEPKPVTKKKSSKGTKSKKKVENIGSTVDEAVSELSGDTGDVEDIYNGLDDINFDDFGFGDMLKGSKFGG